MFQALKIAVLAAFAQIAEGHVRALPTGANSVGCRDCNGKATPGPFRVNGPLGRVKAFGANGVEVVKEGQEVELAIGYNGGHQSNTLNFFNVRYACGAATNGDAAFKRIGPQDKNTINCNAPCKQLTANEILEVDGNPANANNYPIDATASNRDGYKVKFKMPTIQGTGDARKCTFALVEGRDWGAAWDFEIQPANAAPPPAPPAPAPVNLQGTYDFTDANCQKDAPDCQCLTGYIRVQHTNDAETAKASLNMPGYPVQVIDVKKDNGAWSAKYTLSTCDGRPDEQLDITLAKDSSQTSGSILNIGVVSADPKVCGSIVKSGPANQAGKAFNPTNIPNKQCPQCQDIANWVDSDNDKCSAYTSCDGEKWRAYPFDFYKKHAVNGVSAREACCGCGGGTNPLQNPPTKSPPSNGGGQSPPSNGGGQSPPSNGGGQSPPSNGGNMGGMFGQDKAVEDSASGMVIAFGAVLTVFVSALM